MPDRAVFVDGDWLGAIAFVAGSAGIAAITNSAGAVASTTGSSGGHPIIISQN
ncbi:hypothetical protein J4573_47480 [Actinomadura barringtoniae]|uniref:Uncharacterized protein n=1 Tax=Actinomadura barringtoniae TaxID=1427535 RepID=A0A939PLZ6_9ACTN|nr:hypothetical protein [Actinomadura barringtoniae]MBO2454802.1 hypothetical protein [Actinomadura barringtoniae]